MSFVIIVGLVVAVIALLIAYGQLNKENQSLRESTPKTRKKRNGTNKK